MIAGLVRDIDNTRSAIDWLIARDQSDDAAQVVSMLSMVIKHRYHSADTLLAKVLAQPLADRSRAQVLVAAGFSAWISGNIPRAAELGSEAEQLAVAVDDQQSLRLPASSSHSRCSSPIQTWRSQSQPGANGTQTRPVRDVSNATCGPTPR